MEKFDPIVSNNNFERLENIEREKAVEEIVAGAFLEMKRRYGSGVEDGENPKAFHNLLHVKNVEEAAKRIAELALKNGKIAKEDVGLIRIAAAYHDIEQDLGGGENEDVSAAVAEKVFEKYNVFKKEEIEKVKAMILATKVFFKDGVMRQSATEDVLTKIMADSDLSHLGDKPEIYWENALRFLQETKGVKDISEDEIKIFALSQAKFLSERNFYTEEAASVFKYLQENIEFSRNKS